jgi:hypothetical protein
MYFYRDKTDKYDILNIPDDFSYVAKNRKILKHKSGVIVVVYKNLGTFSSVASLACLSY